MAKIDLVKEYDEWKKKRDSREYNYDYDNGGSSDDLVGEYNSWKKNYEASQQRVKPAAQLSQPSLSAPSPIMSATMKLNDPRSANYLDNLADTYAANAWYKRSPEAHASDARNYAATVGAAAKYDGMSYADRLAALEELKTNLRNAPNPEQGAEYQYLKNNIATSQLDAAEYRAEENAKRVQRLKAYDPTTEEEYRQNFQELNSKYPAGEYFSLSSERDAARSQGEWDRVTEINQQIDEWASALSDEREKELVGKVEAFERANRQKEEDTFRHEDYMRNVYPRDVAIGQLYNTDNYDRSSISTPFDSAVAMAIRGAGGEASGDEKKDAQKFAKLKSNFTTKIATDDLKRRYPEYAETIDDVLNHTPFGTTEKHHVQDSDVYKNFMTDEEWLIFYGLLGKNTASDTSAAFDYLKGLKRKLAQRADASLRQGVRDTLKNAPPVLDVLLGGAYDAFALGADVVGAPLAAADFLLQSTDATKGEDGVYRTSYDPQSGLSALHNMAEATRGGVSQAVREEWGEIPAFLHDTVYSAVQSAVGAKTAGTAYTFIMGTGAGASRAKELYYRGATPMEIVSGGLAAGINEALFEYLSLDKLANPDATQSILARVLTQAGIEGSEEIATDIANNISDSLILGNNSDFNESIRTLLSDHPEMTYEEARRRAAGETVEEMLKSGLAGAISGGLSSGTFDAMQAVQDVRTGKNVASNYATGDVIEAGLNADVGTEARRSAEKVQQRIDEGKRVSNRQIGELTRNVAAETSGKASNVASNYAAAYKADTIAEVLEGDGMTADEARQTANAIEKQYNGGDLTEAEQKLTESRPAQDYIQAVEARVSADDVRDVALANYVQKAATTRGQGSTKANKTVRESNLQKVFENAMSQKLKVKQLSKNEVDDANKTTLTLSDNGKTTYKGETVEIARPVTVDGENTTVELDNGETVKLKDVSFGSRNEAVVWEVLSGVDGMSAKSLSEFVAAAEKIPAGVSAGVWARGIAEGYSIGKADILGTREFPKAESQARYLSNAGQDARRLSEELGRRDMRESRRQTSINEERTAANTKENETKSEQVKRTTDMLDRLGRKYEVRSDITGDGYIESDGTIVLNDKAKDPLGFVVKHELTHFGETSKYYDDFVTAVKKSKAFTEWLDRNVTRDGTQAQQEASYINAIRDRYQRHGVRLTNTTAHNEMIANFVGDTLFNENGVGLDGITSGLEVKDRNAIMRFLNKLADFFRKHFTKGGETAYLEHFFNQLQSTATGEIGEDTYSIPESEEKKRERQSIREIKRLNETVTHLKDMLKLQRTQTHGTVMNKASVERQADRLMDRWDVYVGKGELSGLLRTFYSTVAQKVNDRELTWDYVAEAAEPVVQYLMSKQQAEAEDDYVKNIINNTLKGKAIRLNDIQRGEVIHRYGSVTEWQKAIAGTVKLRNDGIELDVLWDELSSEYPEYFSSGVTTDADMPIRLAEAAEELKKSRRVEEMLPGEAYDETRRDMLYDVYESFFEAVPTQTLADKQAKEVAELKAKAYNKIEMVRDAAEDRYNQLKKEDRERLERLRKDKNARIEEVRNEEREKRRRDRERHKKSQLRAEIKDRIADFDVKLFRNSKNKYVPIEFVKAVAEFLNDINRGAREGTKVSEKIAALKVKYEALQNDKYAKAAYNEVVGSLLGKVAEEIKDTPLPEMSAYQLELLNNTLKALKHRIDNAISVDNISKKHDAFDYARELIRELNDIAPGKLTGSGLGKLVDMQIRPETFFERLGGFKKDSFWSRLYAAFDEAQLAETRMSVDAQQMFTDLLSDEKNFKKLSDEVDIGLTDENGNPVLISRGMMLTIRRSLMNADNTRHIVGGGFTVPDFKLYYKGKMADAFNKNGKRVYGFAADAAALNEQLYQLTREREALQDGDDTTEIDARMAEIRERLGEIKTRSDAYAAQLAATIDDQLTMYEQNLLSLADVLFDEWSKDTLNETTLKVYGFKKANVEKYLPIKVDDSYVEARFDTFSKDISQENAGFMKDRVISSKPVILEDLTDIISEHIKKVSRYAAYLPIIDEFKRIYNVTLPGSTDSVQAALVKRFKGNEAVEFISNLMNDIQGGRRGGTITQFDRLRSRLAGATLTLNARVALAQAASFPTAAAELGHKAVTKALSKTFAKTDKDLILKWSPLLAYRTWGFSSTELGDARRIKDVRHSVNNKLRWLTGWITLVDSYTVGHLWYAAEYYVNDNFKELEKGSDAYYEQVAKVFNRVVEKTQPNYTTLQRPEIMRTDNALLKQLSMFMTQRLQNTNILYESFARYNKYKKDYKAGKNGVTLEDVKEARRERTRAITSQLIAAATISIIKNLTDLLLHSFKKRDDDEDYDLTDAGWNLLDAFCDSIFSNVMFGSEAYSFVKSKITGDRYYGISLGGLSTIEDAFNDASTLVDACKKAFNGEDFNVKAVKNLGYTLSRLAGIPLQNAVKYVEAISGWVDDAKAGQVNSANYYGKTGVKIYLAEGRVDDAIKNIKEQMDKGVNMQSTVRDFYKDTYLQAKERGDKSTMAEVGKALEKIIKETGVYQKSADKILAGWVQQAEKKAEEEKEKSK